MNSEIPHLNRPSIVAIPRGNERDGIAEVISNELMTLGYEPVHFQIGSLIPKKAEVVFSFGPYGNFLTIPRQLAAMQPSQKPIFVHWNTEGIPDPRIPWKIMNAIAGWRSWLGRIHDSQNSSRRVDRTEKLSSLNKSRMLRFRNLGDYYYAQRRGWLDIFADTSAIYAEIHRQHGLPTIVAPWGATAQWYKDLGLERDIDVLWMGTRGTNRRSTILDKVRSQLETNGVRMYVADGRENPFIFGARRTGYLNRSKITLNITRTWYDDNFSRIALASSNRSLIVSESVLPHCPSFIGGTHYVAVPVERLAETIQYYLDNEEERLRIVDNAYQLVTSKLPLRESIKSIMDAVIRIYQSIHPTDQRLLLDTSNLPG